MGKSDNDKHGLSVIYRHIGLYRVMMNILYGFGYRKRFLPIIEIISRLKPRNILELCFGDTVIASYCRTHGIQWLGIDSNEYFVSRAVRRGLDAQCIDLLGPVVFNQADMVIIAGSLYHFHGDENRLLSMMIKAAPAVIISEPILNLSNQKNWLGWLARKGSNAGHGEEAFRYTRETLLQMLAEQGKLLGFTVEKIGYYKKDCIVQLTRIVQS